MTSYKIILKPQKFEVYCSRYQKSNKDSKMLAEEVAKAIAREESLFENAKTDTVLLIIDRSEDPVTPLLNQWTYEAMVMLKSFDFCFIVDLC